MGPVVQKQVSLTLDQLRIQTKFLKYLLVNLKIFFHKSCLDRIKELFVSTNNKFIASSLSVFVGWVARDTYYRGMRLWISS